ncbi:MAG: hypothetical protein CSA72_00825 [Rhodobacterales bacterium]|nr:MAG: hypothetical protein CSA72_00825 [Rhodobacterales bacterium]
MANWIGSAAAILGILCWLPQVAKTWRSRHTGDLSLTGHVLILVTLLLWLIYGVLIGSLPIIAGNTISVTLVGSIVIAKLIYG